MSISPDFRPQPLEFTEVWRRKELVAIRVHIDGESVAVPKEDWSRYLSGNLPRRSCAVAHSSLTRNPPLTLEVTL